MMNLIAKHGSRLQNGKSLRYLRETTCSGVFKGGRVAWHRAGVGSEGREIFCAVWDVAPKTFGVFVFPSEPN